MSFRGDDSRRYGHVPPAQYPVATTPSQDPRAYAPRRPSFDDGDEASFFDASARGPSPFPSQAYAQPGAAARAANDELFLTSPTTATTAHQPPPPPPPPPSSSSSSRTNRQGSFTSSSPAIGGYQHQYQGYQAPPAPAAYNPQQFARSQSTSLPYHPHPSARYAATTPVSPSYAPSTTLPAAAAAAPPPPPPPPHPPQSSSYPSSATAPTSPGYAPVQTYNPAAYATTHLPQRNATVAGYNHFPYSYSSPAVPQVSAYQQQAAAAAAAASTYSPPPSSTHVATPPTQSGYPASSLSSPHYAATPSPGGLSSVSPRYEPSASPYGSGSYFSSRPPAPTAASTAAASQPPYPAYTHIPVGPNYSAQDPNSFMSRASRSSSLDSPPASLYSHPSPGGGVGGGGGGLQRHPTNAPLPSRPMEELPEEPDWNPHGLQPPYDVDEDDSSSEHVTQESLIQDIVSDLGVAGHHHHHHQATVNGGSGAGHGGASDGLHRYGSTSSSSISPSLRTDASSADDRYASSASTPRNERHAAPPYDWDDDESDPEAVAGLLAMQEAAMDDRRFSTLPTFQYGDPPPQQSQQHAQQQQQQQQQQPHSHLPPPPEEQESSDSDFGGMDLGLIGGGYAGNLQYGNEFPAESRPMPPPSSARDRERSEPFPPFSDVSVDYGDTGGLLAPEMHRLSFDEGGEERVSVHSRRSDGESPRRQQQQQQEEEEDYPDMFYHPGLTNRPLPAIPPGSDSSSFLSVHSSNNNNNNRAPYQQHGYSLSADARTPYHQDDYYAAGHLTAGAQQQQQQQLHVERSISMSSHSNTPQVQAPARSRTDAAEERRRALLRHHQQLAGGGGGGGGGYYYDASSTTTTAVGSAAYDAGTPTSTSAASLAAYDLITLPTGRKRKFVPGKLTAADVRRCAEPWALSAVTAWVREMAEGDPEVKRKTIEEGLVRLFCAKVPTMNVADAEVLGAQVVDALFAAGVLAPEEEWVKFGPGSRSLSGVLWQLTGSGCYAPKVHEDEAAQAPRLPNDGGSGSGSSSSLGLPLRCYSHHCGRTLKKADLDRLPSWDDVEPPPQAVGWVEFYGVSAAEMERKGRKEVERQNVLHEIVTGEEEYMNQLDVLRRLYRDQLRARRPPIIPAARLGRFVEDVFGQVEAVQQINREHLLAQLKYRQKEQGPWIVGFSDLFREWIRKARPVYVAFSAAYPQASYLVRREAERNLLFRQFLDVVRDHPRSRRLEWTTFLKAPITRLQRYGLLLETVRKNMVGDSEEKANLGRALEEIRAVTRECDEKVDEMTKKVALLELQSMLVVRPGFQSVLHLDHLGRELIRQGDLQRQGSKGVRWVDTHALLFDHYFILAKAVGAKDGRGPKKYDVSKEPIPMPLLFLESINDDPVSKQKGLAAPLARTTAATGSGTQLNKVVSNGVTGSSTGSDRPGLEHASTGSSMGSLTSTSTASTTTPAVTRLTPSTTAGGGVGGGADPEGKIIYPFRVKHLGHEVYTLYATTQQDREAWCSAIIEAKTRYARALHAQNAEPFRLRVLADQAFAYDSATLAAMPAAAAAAAGVSIRGTPLDRALREMEAVYGPSRGASPPVCRAQVNCAAAFQAYGRSLIAVGTDYGIYISEASNPRGWTRTVQAARVTQMAVLEEFSTCLVIADKALISYPLEAVAPVSSSFPAPAHDNPKRAPQRLAKDVAFFATARMKERTLLFYKRKEGMHNTFRVLEPVFQKATEKRSRFLFGGGSSSSRRAATGGTTESFRDFDEFYLPTECYSLNLFQTYIAVASAKGFELLTLDKKIPQSIPRDLALPATANIAARIRDQRPLGMFKLNDQEFLLTYEDCAVYVDKHGEVSRTLIMEYSGKQKKAKGATMFGPYLVLFNDDYVEIRNAENGRLRQIIAGRDVRCLDYGYRGPTGGGQSLAASAPPPPSSSSSVGGPESKGTVKICMSHPEVPGGQLVLEMLLNDGHREELGRVEKKM